jgi:adenine deaminase
VRVIGVIENQAPTRALEAQLWPSRGVSCRWTATNDVCQIALVERHRGNGAGVERRVRLRLRLHARDCAMASTVAHDSHHMIVVGTNREDMAIAANRLGEIGGGVT